MLQVGTYIDRLVECEIACLGIANIRRTVLLRVLAMFPRSILAILCLELLGIIVDDGDELPAFG